MINSETTMVSADKILSADVIRHVYPAGAWSEVKEVWQELEQRSPYTSFFISSIWVESWLSVFGDSLPVELVIFRASGLPVGACVLVRRIRRHGPFRLRRVFLNTSGEDPGDSPYIEFNNVLCLAGWEQTLARALHDLVHRQSWDEFILNGFCQGAPLQALRQSFSRFSETKVTKANYYVDLSRIRDSQQPYLSALRAKNRTRVRRFFKDYGETTVEQARTAAQAQQMLEELAGLHQQTWSNRGQVGAFASQRFVSFHRRLVENAFGLGAIQLVRVRAIHTVGLLYNFIYGGNVYFYQSGLDYSVCPSGKPGFVTIVSVINHCLGNPALKTFQFMPGGGEYKEPLATGCDEQEWIVFKSKSWRNRLVWRVQGLKNRGALLRREKVPPVAEMGQPSVPSTNDRAHDSTE